MRRSTRALVHRPGARRLGQDRAAGAALPQASCARRRSRKKSSPSPSPRRPRPRCASACWRSFPNAARDRPPPAHPDHRRVLRRAHAPDAGAGALRRAARDHRGREPSSTWKPRRASSRNSIPPTERLLAHLDNNIPLATALLAKMLREPRPLAAQDRRRADARANWKRLCFSRRNRLLERAQALYPKRLGRPRAASSSPRTATWRKRDRARPVALRQRAAAPGARRPVQHAAGEVRRPAVGGARSDPRAAHARRRAAEGAVRRARPGRLHRVRARRARRARLGRRPERPAALARPEDLAHPGRRVPGHLAVAVCPARKTGFRMAERTTAARCSSSATRCSRSTASAKPKCRLFLQCASTRASAPCASSRSRSATNRRSQEGLVDWFNAAFPRVLPARRTKPRAPSPYSPRHAHRADARRRRGELALLLRPRAGSCPGRFTSCKASQGKKAILVRNRAHLDEIVPALKEAGVRFKALDIEQLGEKQVVQDLYALTRALLHLGDRIAWLAVPARALVRPDARRSAALSSAPLTRGERVHERGVLVFDLLHDVAHLSPDGQSARRPRALRPRAARRRTACAAPCATASRARGSRSAAPRASRAPPTSRTPTIFLDELERLEEAGEVDLAALEDKIERRLYALPDVEAGRRRGRDHDHPPRQGPRVRHRHRPRPRPPASLRPQAALRLEVASIVPRDGAACLLSRPSTRPAPAKTRPTSMCASSTRTPTTSSPAASSTSPPRARSSACTSSPARRPPKTCAASEPSRRSLLSKIWWQAREHFGPAPADAIAGRAARADPRCAAAGSPPTSPRPTRPIPARWSAPPEGRAEEPRSSSPGPARRRGTSAPSCTAGCSASRRTN